VFVGRREPAIFSAAASLEIGCYAAPKPATITLPSASGSLKSLSVTAGKVTNFDALAKSPDLKRTAGVFLRTGEQSQHRKIRPAGRRRSQVRLSPRNASTSGRMDFQ
jgi:hypothetical protein